MQAGCAASLGSALRPMQPRASRQGCGAFKLGLRVRAPGTPGAPSLGLPRTSRTVLVKAVSLPPKQLTVKRQLGEGSFGQVFEGTWQSPSGVERVVLKRVKAKVQGADEMQEMELALNQYAAKAARGHCADFIGYSAVSDEEARRSTLTTGLWLMWKYEGSRTLDYYLRRRDTIRALARDLDVPEASVVPTIMKQIFSSLEAFHSAGLVHRDVKPANVIFAEEERRFKLIDLGACADLRTGKNYVPDESILDPMYAPPEKYVLPTDSPHLAKSFLDRAMSPMLWTRYGPDRFDMWSAGMVMMQLSLPPMRNDRGLSQFHKTVSSCGVRACTRVSQGKQSTHAPARCITGSVCSVGGEAGEGDGGADGQQAMRLRLRASLFRCSS